MKTAAAPRAARREGGFSLVEVIIGAVILVGIVLLTAIILQSGNRLLGVTSAQAEAENRAGGIAEQICQRMRSGILSTVTDGAGVPLADGAISTNGLGVTTFINWKGVAVGGESFRFVLRNGELNVVDTIDNDRDNYVDEKSLHIQRWTGNPIGPPVAEVQLGTNIQSMRVTRTGRLITVVITVMRYDATMREVRTFVHRAETSLRN